MFEILECANVSVDSNNYKNVLKVKLMQWYGLC